MPRKNAPIKGLQLVGIDQLSSTLYTRQEIAIAIGAEPFQVSRDVKAMWPSKPSHSNLTKAEGYTLYLIGCIRKLVEAQGPDRQHIHYSTIRKMLAAEEKLEALLKCLQDEAGNPAGYADYEKRLQRLELDKLRQIAQQTVDVEPVIA